MTLWKHQAVNAEHLVWLLHQRMVGVDCSETGTGKTISSLEAVRRFALPFLVVCPKSLKSHWQNWITEAREDSPFPFCHGVYGWEEMRAGKYPLLYDSGGQWFKDSPGQKHLVIFDEAHRAKNAKTLSSKMVNAATRQGIYLLLLSATLVQSALDLAGLGYPLRLIAKPRYWFEFAKGFGARIHPLFRGYADHSTREQQKKLGALLDKIRVRTRRSEIAQIIPALTQSDLVDSAQLPAIRAQYEELNQAVEDLERLGASAAQILVERLRRRQAIELLKVPLFVEQAKEHLEAGFKVCLFFNFTQSIRAAAGMLLPVPVGIIDGLSDAAAREEAIRAFNSPDGDLPVLLLNLGAGGEGLNLQDIHGNCPRVSLLSPPESASQLVQACGRIGGRIGARSVGLNRVLFVANTIEETVHANVAHKINRLETLNDGDLKWKVSSQVRPVETLKK